MNFPQILKSWLLLALGVVLASYTATGIHYDSNGALVVAVLLLSLCNVFLKPLLMLFSLPFIVLTFGIGIWLINALLFLLVGELVEGFYVASFWNALWGALVVSITGAAANALFGNTRVRVQSGQGSNQDARRNLRKTNKDDDDVIDV